ncbi:MAG: hypothetical protein ABW005_09610 [Burkholderiaceae bacterium]
MSERNPRPALPWWRVRMMWLVVMGPAAVVVASFVTLALAVHGGDPPLKLGVATHAADADTPAAQARNHAATATR